MNHIKVCHMTSVHSQFDGRIFLKECVSLANYGYQVYLVSQGEGIVERDGVICVGAGKRPVSRLKRMTSFSKTVYKKALELDCDIYHFHDPELLPYALRLKRKGKKVIYDSHEIYVEQLKRREYLPAVISKLIAKCYEIYEGHVTRRIDGAIVPCTVAGKNIFEKKCRNYTTVDNYPILSELYDKYQPDVAKYDKSICYVGSLTEDRGITDIILAGYKAGCQVYLAGSFDSEEYKSSVMKMPEYSCVHYMGVLNREEVCELIQHCKIGMAILQNVGQYNATDNMPTKVFEYMSLGIPVILTSAPYNEKMMREIDFGLCVDPSNIDEIVSGITSLLSDAEMIKSKGLNGRNAVKERFNWNTQAERLALFYKKILE